MLVVKKVVKVIFENGDCFFTEINGTKEEIEKYYIGKYFNIGTVLDDMQKCIDVKIMQEVYGE